MDVRSRWADMDQLRSVASDYQKELLAGILFY